MSTAWWLNNGILFSHTVLEAVCPNQDVGGSQGESALLLLASGGWGRSLTCGDTPVFTTPPPLAYLISLSLPPLRTCVMIFRAHQDHLLSAEILNLNTSADCVLYKVTLTGFKTCYLWRTPFSPLHLLSLYSKTLSLFDGFPYVFCSLCLKICLMIYSYPSFVLVSTCMEYLFPRVFVCP